MLKNNKGLTGTDIVITIVVIGFFATTILALIYNVKLENLKIKSKLVANIYLIQTLENVGIVTYDDVTTDNVTNLIPADLPDGYTSQMTVTNFNDEDNTKEDLIKMVEVKISYQIGNKTYEETAQRLKVKEY